MFLPAFKPSVSPDVEATIQAKLKALEADHDVRILFAIESGSRAWGFPSPDSDYDVRFVYAHKSQWYLSIKPGRDVIELPIEGDWDINGWDIRKALGLLVKPNPVMLEWLSSPIRYRWNEDICDALTVFAGKTTHGPSCLHHYRNLAQQQLAKHIRENNEVNYKKYFYILRPALAISWIRQNTSNSPPPMNLQDLVAGQTLPAEFVEHINQLLVLKSTAKETGGGKRIAMIDEFVEDQINWASVVSKSNEQPDLMNEGDELLRSIVAG